MMVTYWLDLFTGPTWDQYIKAGGQISGFREARRRSVSKMQPGDILLCYLTGVSRWIGALEVVDQSSNKDNIWNNGTDSTLEFPARVQVKPLIILNPEYGVPLENLKGKVSFFKDDSDRQYYKGFLRQSPLQFDDSDGALVYSLIKEAKANPVLRQIDLSKLKRIPYYKVKEGKKTVTVTVPEKDDENEGVTVLPVDEQPVTPHTEIQYYLIKLGSDMGLNVWVANNDRSKRYNNEVFGEMPRVITSLPTQFNQATQKTIELIDVLWLKGNAIEAAFEIEATTSIYSGLLRMSDLLALQPNLDIKLYLVAQEDKYDKVKKEILRPTFEKREKPLSKICGYITFAELAEKTKAIQGLGIASSLNPNFLRNVAHYFEAEED